MRNAKGEYLIGHGPFESSEECSGEGVEFYINDFSLECAKPWKKPSRVERCMTLPYIESSCSVSWDEVELSPFAQVFSEVNDAIIRGEIQKSVPCVTECGKIKHGKLKNLIFSTKKEHVYNAYAWVDGDKGFCGLTPEVLFSHERGVLKTMALAGTAALAEKAVFFVDEKEIKEHEFVAQTLIAKLSEVGMVKIKSRGMMELDALVHFYTPIEVGLYNAVSLQDLLKRLHPTPALGSLPRTSHSMNKLIEWRRRVSCPKFFGAPMGVYDNGTFHAVVCIRGLHWDGDNVYLPSGCGVIEASRLTSEWRELALKRDSVKQLFEVH